MSLGICRAVDLTEVNESIKARFSDAAKSSATDTKRRRHFERPFYLITFCQCGKCVCFRYRLSGMVRINLTILHC